MIALASSHAYLVIRAFTRWILTRFVWDGSIAQQFVKRRELELKRSWLDEQGMRIPPKEMARRAMGWVGEKAEEEQKREGHEGYKVEEVGAPADAAANVETLPDFWKREDEAGRIVQAIGKTD